MPMYRLHALLANTSSSARIFIALNDSKYVCKALCTPHSLLHELDSCNERLVHVDRPLRRGDCAAIDAGVRLSCTGSGYGSYMISAYT